MKYRLVMEHAANPDLNDRGGYWGGAIDASRTFADIDTLAEASRTFREWIDRNDLGGGNITAESGMVYETKTGTAVARVSYNGRVWTPEAYPDCTEIDIDTEATEEVTAKDAVSDYCLGLLA